MGPLSYRALRTTSPKSLNKTHVRYHCDVLYAGISRFILASTSRTYNGGHLLLVNLISHCMQRRIFVALGISPDIRQMVAGEKIR